MNTPIGPVQGPIQGEDAQVERAGIVSVNDRGVGGGNPLGKVFFVVGVLGLILVAGFYTYNKYHAAQEAKDAAAKQTNKNESKPAAAGVTRDFDKDQAAAEQAAAASSGPPIQVPRHRPLRNCAPMGRPAPRRLDRTTGRC